MSRTLKESKIQDMIIEHYKSGGNALDLAGEIFEIQKEVSIGSSGRVDLAVTHGTRESLIITIIELKTGNLRSQHVGQICRYKAAIDNKEANTGGAKVEYILMGKKPRSFRNTCLDPYYIASCVDGLKIAHYDNGVKDGVEYTLVNSFMGTKSDPFKAIESAGGIVEPFLGIDLIAEFSNPNLL